MAQKTWNDRLIWLAALPPALLGLALGLSMIAVVPYTRVVLGGATPLSAIRLGTVLWWPQALLLASTLVLSGGALLAVARRLPMWGYTWVTSSIVVTALGLSFLADDVEYLISPEVDLTLLVGLVGLLAAVTLVASRRGEFDSALVSLGFVSSFSLVVLLCAVASPMLRLDLAALTLPFGLLYSWLVHRMVSKRPSVSVRVVVIAALLAALMIGSYGYAVARALSWSLALTFLRVLGAIAAVGLTVPLALGRLLDARRKRGLLGEPDR